MHFDTIVAPSTLPSADQRRLRLGLRAVDSLGNRYTHWAPYARGDSIYALLGDGYTGVQLRLQLVNDSLVGRGYTLSDVSTHVTQSGSVRGTRIACQALYPGG